MKFPKEQARTNIKINEYLNKEDYISIYNMKDEILTNYQELNNFAFDNLVKSCFFLKKYDQVVILYFEFLKKEIETYSIVYYTILALIANIDIYQALSIINKSKLLKQEQLQIYFEIDGANYLNLIKSNKLLEEEQLAILVVNFLKGISRELANNIELDQEYILFRFFDLINMLYEIGYPDGIITKLIFALKIIFNIEI